MSPPNLGQQTAEARREIDFRDMILINITLVYCYVSERIKQNACAFSKCYSLSSTRLPMIAV